VSKFLGRCAHGSRAPDRGNKALENETLDRSLAGNRDDRNA